MTPEEIIEVLAAHKLSTQGLRGGARLSLYSQHIVGFDFSGMNLSDATFDGCSFVDCKFVGTLFHRSYLAYSITTNCDFTNASFQRANLHGVGFEESQLSGADFQTAQISSQSFTRAKIDGIKLDAGLIFIRPISRGVNQLFRSRDTQYWRMGDGREVHIGTVKLKVPLPGYSSSRECRTQRFADNNDLSVGDATKIIDLLPRLIHREFLLSQNYCEDCNRLEEFCECRSCACGCGTFVGPDESYVDGHQPEEEDEARGDWTHTHRPLVFRDPRIRGKVGTLYRYLGVEVEIDEAATPARIEEAASDIKANLVGDGSLSGRGIEIVTQPARGMKFRDDIKHLALGLEQGGAVVRDNCGLHVHVDGRDFDILAVQRLAALYSKVEPAMFDLVAASRRDAHYSKYAKHFYRYFVSAKGRDDAQKQYDVTLYGRSACSRDTRDLLAQSKAHKYEGCRYYALNLHSWSLRKTFEFRHHQGTVLEPRIVGWAEVCGWVVQKALDMRRSEIDALDGTPQEILLSLLPKPLATWCEARSKVLSKWRKGQSSGSDRLEDRGVAGDEPNPIAIPDSQVLAALHGGPADLSNLYSPGAEMANAVAGELRLFYSGLTAELRPSRVYSYTVLEDRVYNEGDGEP